MPIPFDCPHCGLQTLVEDEYAGQSGPCASCGKTITVPYEPMSGDTATMVRVYTRPAKAPVGNRSTGPSQKWTRVLGDNLLANRAAVGDFGEPTQSGEMG